LPHILEAFTIAHINKNIIIIDIIIAAIIAPIELFIISPKSLFPANLSPPPLALAFELAFCCSLYFCFALYVK